MISFVYKDLLESPGLAEKYFLLACREKKYELGIIEKNDIKDKDLGIDYETPELEQTEIDKMWLFCAEKAAELNFPNLAKQLLNKSEDQEDVRAQMCNADILLKNGDTEQGLQILETLFGKIFLIRIKPRRQKITFHPHYQQNEARKIRRS